ncbi:MULTISPECIES: hypothetical protein [Halolamina]|uniref:DUF2238 domain-containing protein n=1 Tax=Halolamina pelagica TaxID=699431 RepID=A0A1I5UX46_9EURY|nr:MULTISPECIES: hypothetical protein [Halolamina]NHX36837.1 DUF2238 domain-containing protein [Halolamina sp. R1-12]SFP99788.1 hypothetical protein SAMN05216277_11514 [Halolamina pelagica]
MRIRDRLGLSDRQQRIAAQAMQYGLFGMIAVGFYEGSVGVMVNAGVGFAVTYIPALLKRDYDIQLDPALVLWITLAVFLHGFGTVGLPGAEAHPYRAVPWWDHMTHTFSASIVAGAGYVTVRALDEHTDAVRFPPRFVFVFILLFTMAFGVLWEVLEFAITLVAQAIGAPAVLTQYGLEDTMKDLLFDTLGGIVVGLWGTAYLTGLTESLTDRLRARSGAE